MMRSSFHANLVAVCIGLLGVTGCSDQPKAPPGCMVNPAAASQEAMRLYDKNQDGKLDAKELEASPPLHDLLLNLKMRNLIQEDSLTEADIRQRLAEWINAPAAILGGAATVYLDDKPLEGAIVTYVPEPFLGASYRSHQGQTDARGRATLDPDDENFPGLHFGLYRVQISKKVGGKETIPARYNTATELGFELATQVRDIHNQGNFALKSK